MSPRRREVLGDVLGLDDDAIAVTDAASAFYGWTNRQINAYWAAQNVPVMTNAVAASQHFDANGVVTYDADVFEQSQRELVAEALTDPVVAAALETLQTGAFGSDVDLRNAVNESINYDIAVQDADAAIASIKASGGVFETAADEEAYRAQLMRWSGFDADGHFVGEPENNPNAMSLEEAIDAGVLTVDQAQYIADKAAGRDVSGSPFAPAPVSAPDEVYIVGGQYVDRTGRPISPATLAALGFRPMTSTSGADDSAPSRAVFAGGGGTLPSWLLPAAAAVGALYLLSRR